MREAQIGGPMSEPVVQERIDAVRVRLPVGEVELDPLSAAVLRGLLENREDVAVVHLGLLLAGSRRQSEGKPAQVVLNVPDEVVKSIRGEESRRPLVALVHIPRSVLEQWDRLIVPASAGVPARRGGLIVAP